MPEPQYLLRVWGRDQDQVREARTPDAVEEQRVLCYWFDTPAERAAFLASWPDWHVVRDCTDPGIDWDGEVVEPRMRTVAHVVLRQPSGEVTEFDYDFGFGYTEHAARYMWEEGNYSCDCNKRLIAKLLASDEEENPCGDTIALESLTVTKHQR